MSSPLNFHLEQYDGPLDLLLDLIRKQEINIYDIPIARITQQYLEYMQKAAEMDIELSAEFVYMAATLIHIKSRMLLPRDPELDKLLPEEDPRQELVDRLLEHERFKNAAQMLYQREMVEKVSWNNPGEIPFEDSELEPQMTVTLYDLLLAFRDVVKRAESRPMMEVSRDEFSIEQMMGYLFDKIVSANKDVTLTEVLPAINSRRGLITAFLALLELTRLKAIFLRQERALGEINLRANSNYELSQSFRPA